VIRCDAILAGWVSVKIAQKAPQVQRSGSVQTPKQAAMSAMQLYMRALKMREGRLGPQHTETLVLLARIVSVLNSQVK